jgi:hypothetical protein
MGESPVATDARPLSLERVIFFSDAVFAIVITLLVLPITTDVELPAGHGGSAHQVWALWPRVLSFVVSFLVIGQFWIAHHRMVNHLRSAGDWSRRLWTAPRPKTSPYGRWPPQECSWPRSALPSSVCPRPCCAGWC